MKAASFSTPSVSASSCALVAGSYNRAGGGMCSDQPLDWDILSKSIPWASCFWKGETPERLLSKCACSFLLSHSSDSVWVQCPHCYASIDVSILKHYSSPHDYVSGSRRVAQQKVPNVSFLPRRDRRWSNVLRDEPHRLLGGSDAEADDGSLAPVYEWDEESAQIVAVRGCDTGSMTTIPATHGIAEASQRPPSPSPPADPRGTASAGASSRSVRDGSVRPLQPLSSGSSTSIGSLLPSSPSISALAQATALAAAQSHGQPARAGEGAAELGDASSGSLALHAAGLPVTASSSPAPRAARKRRRRRSASPPAAGERLGTSASTSASPASTPAPARSKAKHARRTHSEKRQTRTSTEGPAVSPDRRKRRRTAVRKISAPVKVEMDSENPGPSTPGAPPRSTGPCSPAREEADGASPRQSDEPSNEKKVSTRTPRIRAKSQAAKKRTSRTPTTRSRRPRRPNRSATKLGPSSVGP